MSKIDKTDSPKVVLLPTVLRRVGQQSVAIPDRPTAQIYALDQIATRQVHSPVKSMARPLSFIARFRAKRRAVDPFAERLARLS